MQLNDIRALVASDLAAVDAEIRRQLASDVALVNQVGTTSSPAAESACVPCSSYSPPMPPAHGHGPHPGRRTDRVHPHGDPAARRRRRRVGAPPGTRDREPCVREPRLRAGRRLPILARIPDDGRARLRRRHPRDGRRDQHDRGRRSHAAHELGRPGHDRDPVHGGHLSQDRAAVRGRRADRSDRRARPAGSRPRSRATASTSASRSSSSTTRSTIAAMTTSSARTSATTSPRASRRCR